MKKIYFVFALLLTFSVSSVAQIVTFDPDTVRVDGITAADVDIAAHSSMTNTSGQGLALQWTRNVIDMTDGWTSGICDNNGCYLAHVDQANLALGVDESSTLDVHVYPNGHEGHAIIEVIVTDRVDTTQTTSNIYFFNITESSNNTLNIERTELKVYPNPTYGSLNITENDFTESVEVYNLTGQPVANFKYRRGETFDIGHLPKGNYMVRIMGENGRSLVTRLVQKL